MVFRLSKCETSAEEVLLSIFVLYRYERYFIDTCILSLCSSENDKLYINILLNEWRCQVVAQRHNRLTVNATGCGFDSHSNQWSNKYFHLFTLMSGVCLNTKLSTLPYYIRVTVWSGKKNPKQNFNSQQSYIGNPVPIIPWSLYIVSGITV